ncbi:MAG: glutamyl-tRNA reductase, partial [Bacillota bacterium]
MNIFVSGINHKTTPLDIREKLSFTTGEQKELLKEIKTISGVSECVILSTCNRTEVYIHSESSGFEGEKIESLLCNVKGFDLYEFKKYFYFYTSSRAVSHAFKVASGLDSQVLGEDQILTQVKDAHSLALECGTSSVVLNTLFREIVTCAKRIKTYTSLSRNSISVGSLAVGLVSDFFAGKLDKKCALVIGTGKIGAISLKYLISAGVGKIYITNRTHGRADSLSRIHGAVTVIDYNSRYSVMNECDIIISSTSSPHYTITRDVLEHSIHEFKERVIVDLAV